MYSDPITKSNILQIFTYTSFNSLFAGFLLSVYFPLSIVNTFYVAVIYRKTENTVQKELMSQYNKCM